VFAAPLAMALFACRNWFFRGMYVVLALIGFGLMAIMLADPRRMWPGNPVFEWLRGYLDPYLGGVPSLPITIDLWNFFPGIDPRDDRNMTQASGWLTVVALGILLISYVAMKWEHRMRDRQTRHLPLVAQGGLWAAAILVVGATWYTANFDYLQHKTVLTEVGRTGANPTFAAPRGMDVAGDKVYVADFEAKALGVFNLPAGGFQRLAATTPQGPVEYAQPGAVKVGKDGSIYLLNNGPNEDALLVMSPDGQVIRKVPLNGKTQVAAGLAFDQDGFLLVADVIGGKIWKYGPEGGEPIAAYGGKTGGFNNILGITVAEDGKIYAAESSNSTVQELDPDGNYLRSFDVGCSPFYLAAHSGWLDVTCPNQGIKSINLATGNIQRSTGPGNSPLPTNVVGITYGPDGTLYVLDGSQLVTYKVEH
jgi:sugar lactone lactonase YvrE